MSRRHGGTGNTIGKTSPNSSRRGNGGFSLSWPAVYLIVILTILTFVFGVLTEEQLFVILAFFDIESHYELFALIVFSMIPPFVYIATKIPRKEEKAKKKAKEETERIQAEKDAAARIEMEKWQRENAHKYKNQVGPYANLNNDNKEDDS